MQEFTQKFKNCNECYFVINMPILMEENYSAMKIWGIVQGQRIIAGMTGVTVDINHMAVWQAIDRYEVEEPVRCFEKVLRIAKEIFEIEALEREANKNSK